MTQQQSPTPIPSAEQRSDRIRRHLPGTPREAYAGEYQTHLLEQYRIYVGMADKLSERRAGANTFFLTVNCGLLTAFGFAKLTAHEVSTVFIIIASAAALPLCYSWYRLIRSYRDLSAVKFDVIYQIEQLLPLRPFDTEWESLERGRDVRTYKPFTHVEQLVPWMYILLYAALILFAIIAASTGHARI